MVLFLTSLENNERENLGLRFDFFVTLSMPMLNNCDHLFLSATFLP